MISASLYFKNDIQLASHLLLSGLFLVGSERGGEEWVGVLMPRNIAFLLLVMCGVSGEGEETRVGEMCELIENQFIHTITKITTENLLYTHTPISRK